jgi:hypothetical protein
VSAHAVPPAAVRSTCGLCDGPIVYYPRPDNQPPAKTTTVSDDRRWAHTRLSDTLRNPHRAVPKLEVL